VKLLLSYGANANAPGPGPLYQTPLAQVAQGDRPFAETASLLVLNGAHVDGRTIHTKHLKNFDTPLHYAVRNSRYSFVETLIELGASLEALDYRGISALRIAIKARDRRMIKLIVSQGGNVDMLNAYGSSSLQTLAELQPEHGLSFASDIFWLLKAKCVDGFREKTPRRPRENPIYTEVCSEKDTDLIVL
jgi:hypothetical protein